MAAPTPQNVADFLGQGEDAAILALAGTHLPIVSLMVKAYVRGVGFTADVPDDALAAVIVSSCARSVSNPTHDTFVSVDDASIRQGTFQGWSLAELALLHTYRARAR